MEITDQIGRTVLFSRAPKRIVSLVPSQTELLHYLGLSNEVVGITKFCIYPKDWFETKQRIGGTKSIDLALVESLEPDLIIGNKEENTKEDISVLENIAPTWVSDINSFDDAIHMISQVGLITNRVNEANHLLKEIQGQFKGLESALENVSKKSVLYFIWNEPELVVGQDTFINSMLEKAGYRNECRMARYPSSTSDMNPELVFLSSEPFPFKESHINKFQNLYPNSRIHLVDGEMFSWYGSRMIQAPLYFKKLLETIYNN